MKKYIYSFLILFFILFLKTNSLTTATQDLSDFEPQDTMEHIKYCNPDYNNGDTPNPNIALKVIVDSKCSYPSSKNDCYENNLLYMEESVSGFKYCFEVKYLKQIDDEASGYFYDTNKIHTDITATIGVVTTLMKHIPYDLSLGQINTDPDNDAHKLSECINNIQEDGTTALDRSYCLTSSEIEEAAYIYKLSIESNTDCPKTREIQTTTPNNQCIECDPTAGDWDTTQVCDITNIVTSKLTISKCISDGNSVKTGYCIRPQSKADCGDTETKGKTYFDPLQSKCVSSCQRINYETQVIASIDVTHDGVTRQAQECVSLENCWKAGLTVTTTSPSECTTPESPSSCRYPSKKYYSNSKCVAECSSESLLEYELSNDGDLLKNSCITESACTTNGYIKSGDKCISPNSVSDCNQQFFQEAVDDKVAKCVSEGQCYEDYVSFGIDNDPVLEKQNCITQSTCTDNGFILNESVIPVNSNTTPTKCIEPESSSNCTGTRQYFKVQKSTEPKKCVTYQECYLTWSNVINSADKTCDQYCKDGYGINLQEPDPNTKKICIKCNDKNCLTCRDDYKSCTLCKGSYTSFESVCTACYIPQCKSCSEKEKCSECNDGYALTTEITDEQTKEETIKCSKCTIDNCKTCNAEDLTICTSCIDNFYQYPPVEQLGESEKFTECLIQSESIKKQTINYGETAITNITTSAELNIYMSNLAIGFNNTIITEEEQATITSISNGLADKFVTLFNDTSSQINELIPGLLIFVNGIWYSEPADDLKAKISKIFAETTLNLETSANYDIALEIMDKLIERNNVGTESSEKEENILNSFRYLDKQALIIPKDEWSDWSNSSYSKTRTNFNLEYQLFSQSDLKTTNDTTRLLEDTTETNSETENEEEGENEEGENEGEEEEEEEYTAPAITYDYYLSGKFPRITQEKIIGLTSATSEILFKRLTLKLPLRPQAEKTLSYPLVFEIIDKQGENINYNVLNTTLTDEEKIELDVPNNAEYATVKLETLETTQFTPYYWNNNQWATDGLEYSESKSGAITVKTKHLSEFIFVNELKTEMSYLLKSVIFLLVLLSILFS